MTGTVDVGGGVARGVLVDEDGCASVARGEDDVATVPVAAGTEVVEEDVSIGGSILPFCANATKEGISNPIKISDENNVYGYS